MLIDTHGHINMMIKKTFDTPLTTEHIPSAQQIVREAAEQGVTHIINVGTALVESRNCILLAQKLPTVFATVGLHPNDCTSNWLDDFKKIKALVAKKEENKIVGIGECGVDKHYPDYNLQRQYDAFRAQIELALQHDLAIVVHSRDAYDETLKILDEYKNESMKGTIHCFSYDQKFAQIALDLGFVLGIGGTVTYPKNKTLRDVVLATPLEKIILETDAPFLPPQIIRGKKNHPLHIATIAQFIADLLKVSYETVAHQTTYNATQLFGLE